LAIKKRWPPKSIVATLFLHNVDLNTGGKYNKPRQKKQYFGGKMFRDLLRGISIIRTSIANYKRTRKITNPGKEGKLL
jgi:hypothetical protein